MSHDTLRDAFASAVRSPFQRLSGAHVDDDDRTTLWALRDVSFDVGTGEVVGVVGGNGSGKSTLLKLLARITDPTEGRASLRGRVGALLEVGTGFHPELTGRENTFLNGAILGMGRSEVRAKFDDIVEFSGVGRFLDTPVKRYSSGMYVRLAFSVAAHLEPEVLLVDEVLAVGDAAFQQRCQQRMREVADEGRTVLFVSHNMAAIRNLCPRAVWLDRGRMAASGPTDEVIDAYFASNVRVESLADIGGAIAALPEDPSFRLEHVVVRQGGTPTLDLVEDDEVEVSIAYEVREPLIGFRVFFDLLDENHDVLVRSFHDEQQRSVSKVSPGHYRSVARLPAGVLAPRTYQLRVRATLHDVRGLTGDGLPLTLHVHRTGQRNQAYPSERVVWKLQAPVVWSTTPLDPIRDSR